MSTSSKECVVCHKVNSSYTCPTCSNRYCCAACCKTHKETCVPADKTTTKSIDTSIPEVNDDIHILTDRQKEALLTSSVVNNMLKSKRLRNHLVMIDSSSKRQKTLNNLRCSNSEFEEFAQEMLKVIKGSI